MTKDEAANDVGQREVPDKVIRRTRSALTADDSALVGVAKVLREQASVSAVWLFGSRARGQAHPRSDVDLAVLLPSSDPGGLRRRLQLQVLCADTLGLPADRVDLIVLNDAPALLTHVILREGRLILDAAPSWRVAFEEAELHRFIIAARLRDEAMGARALRLAPELR